MNKYHAKRTYSELCQREFASKWEAERAEQLRLMELAGEIKQLEYQIRFTLSEKPKITVSVDFSYQGKYTVPANTPATSVKNFVEWVLVYEDAKGVLTRDSRTKYAWLKEKYGIEVKLVKRGDR